MITVPSRSLLGAALAAFLIPSAALAQAVLVEGYGGDANFGIGLGHIDDAPSVEVDLSSAFPYGIDFFGTVFSSAWVNNNGNLTFGGPVSAFSPTAFPVSGVPMLAPFWGDADTRAGDVSGPGTNETHYAVDAASGELVVTWYLVGYFASQTSLLNSFQLILTDRSDVAFGDFDVEYRFAQCQWLAGQASGGIPAQMGYDAGNSTDFWSHPYSQSPAILDLCTSSNVGDVGVFRFEIRGGAPAFCGDGNTDAGEQCDDANADANDGCTACLINFDGDSDTFFDDVDCDDGVPSTYPGAPEVCDAADNDCDGIADNGLTFADYYPDGDVDTYGSASAPAVSTCSGAPSAHVTDNTDCDDAAATVYPGNGELCDGLDNDCDGAADEGLNCGACPDGDGDGVCDDVDLCTGNDTTGDTDSDGTCDDLDACIGAETGVDADGDGYCAPTDCDDAAATVYPGNGELCDGLDNDCDGTVPALELDADGDGFLGCEGDCDDVDPERFPGNVESCDEIDNDCDGVVPADEVDADGDASLVCEGDCDDADTQRRAYWPEICGDEIDNDCNDLVDDGCVVEEIACGGPSSCAATTAGGGEPAMWALILGAVGALGARRRRSQR